MSEDGSNRADNEPRIVRGRVDSLSLYEITEHELDALAKGSPSSLQLNFGIFSLTIGLSSLSTLLTVTISSVQIFTAYVVLAVVGCFLGAYLGILWYRMRGSVSDVVDRIRGRIAQDSPIPDESGANPDL